MTHFNFLPPPPDLTLRLCLSRHVCRVYQDAEVHITQNFTSQQPVQLSPKRNLPNATSGVLGLDPHSLVLYVGGYPEEFKVSGLLFI